MFTEAEYGSGFAWASPSDAGSFVRVTPNRDGGARVDVVELGPDEERVATVLFDRGKGRAAGRCLLAGEAWRSGPLFVMPGSMQGTWMVAALSGARPVVFLDCEDGAVLARVLAGERP